MQKQSPSEIVNKLGSLILESLYEYRELLHDKEVSVSVAYLSQQLNGSVATIVFEITAKDPVLIRHTSTLVP